MNQFCDYSERLTIKENHIAQHDYLVLLRTFIKIKKRIGLSAHGTIRLPIKLHPTDN